MKKLLFNKEEVKILLDQLKPEDTIELVGDSGVYLMSFAQKDAENRTIVYALTCNPNKDPDYYENKRYLFGGDDGGDSVGNAESLRRLLTGTRKHIEARLTPTTIQLVG